MSKPAAGRSYGKLHWTMHDQKKYFAIEKQDITILTFGVSIIAQTRPLSATRGKVFFDICILGRKYNFGESEMKVRLYL